MRVGSAFPVRHLYCERVSKIDAELLHIDGLMAAASRTSPMADSKTRRATLGQVAVLKKAWAQADPTVRREIVTLLASEARLVAGQPPVMVWRTAEELSVSVG